MKTKVPRLTVTVYGESCIMAGGPVPVEKIERDDAGDLLCHDYVEVTGTPRELLAIAAAKMCRGQADQRPSQYDYQFALAIREAVAWAIRDFETVRREERKDVRGKPRRCNSPEPARTPVQS